VFVIPGLATSTIMAAGVVRSKTSINLSYARSRIGVRIDWLSLRKSNIRLFPSLRSNLSIKKYAVKNTIKDGKTILRMSVVSIQ
jgi:hypothetical protein